MLWLMYFKIKLPFEGTNMRKTTGSGKQILQSAENMSILTITPGVNIDRQMTPFFSSTL